MKDAQVPLQRALVSAGTADAGINSQIAGRIYDAVPQGATFPYSSFGRMETVGGGGACDAGVEVEAQIDSWSREPGSVQAKTIGAAWAALLGDPSALNVEGFRVVWVRPLRLNGQLGLDRLTSQSSLTVRFALTPTA